MREDKIQELNRLRLTMIEILDSGGALNRKKVIEELRKRGWTERLYPLGKISGLVHDASKLYSADFYRVPMTKQISLTFGMKEHLRRQATARRTAGTAGTTGMAIAAQAMEKREL